MSKKQRKLFKSALFVWFVAVLIGAILQTMQEETPSETLELISNILLWGFGIGIPVLLILMAILQRLGIIGNKA